jgi:hypothetical protein
VWVYYRATAGRCEGTDGFVHNLTEVGVATIRVFGSLTISPSGIRLINTVSADFNLQVRKSVFRLHIPFSAGRQFHDSATNDKPVRVARPALLGGRLERSLSAGCLH